MLTWDDEILEPARRVVAEVHGLEYAFCLVRHDRDQRGHVVNATPFHGSFADHLRPMSLALEQDAEMFMLVGQTIGSGLKVVDITQSWAVALDFDAGLHDLCWNGAPLEPTLAIQTTAPDRFHCVYVLDAPISPEEMVRLARALAARLGADMSMARVNQPIRLPGFKNGKHGQIVTLREDIGRKEPYTFEQLWLLCDGALYEAKVHAALPHLRATTRAPRPPDSLEVQLNHASSAAQHLASHGWADAYETWMPVIANLADLGQAGFSVAEEFSKRSKNFDSEGLVKKWEHFTKVRTGTLNTLFHMAARAGWTNPGFSDSTAPSDQQRELDDREFGERLAGSMCSTHAAIETLPDFRNKASALFLEWTGSAYRVLDDREKRKALHTAGRVFLDGLGTGITKTVAKKLGSNTGLEDIAQHVAEFLVPLTKGRVVGAYPYLAVANGVLNLRNRQLVPADYQAVPLMSCSVTFAPAATAPRFEQFLNEVFKGKSEIRDYMLRILGFMLLGKPVLEQKLFILLGTGSNGKSTFMNAILAMLGKLAVRVPTETLMEKSHVSDGATPALAKLAGKRLLLASEPEKNHRLAVSLIKNLTGETSLPVRSLYSGGVDMPVECVLVMSANKMPFAPDEPAVWRRIRVVPFDNVFPDGGNDKELLDALLAESSGILNKLLEGLADYEAQGLAAPSWATQATEDRRVAADPLTMFLNDQCSVDNTKRSGLKELWAAYQAWAPKHKQLPALLKKEFDERMSLKFERRVLRNLPTFLGVELVELSDG